MEKTTKTFFHEGKDCKVFRITTKYSDNEVIIVPTKYRNNDSLALMMLCVDTKEGIVTEPFAVLTVNLCVDGLSPQQAFVDTNNNGSWNCLDFIEENHIGKFTGVMMPSGYCFYPLYEFDLTKFTV